MEIDAMRTAVATVSVFAKRMTMSSDKKLAA
jgi:hypothetical protein